MGSNLDCCDWEEIDFGTPTPRSRMFRLVMENTHGYAYLSIEQLQLEECSACSALSWDDLANVQLAASSEWSSSYTVNNLKTAGTNPWHNHGSEGKTAWITFTFPGPVALKGLRTKAHSSWDGSAFKEFRFEFSQDEGSTWTSFYQGQGSNLDCCDWEEIDFGTLTPRSRMFRLVMENPHGYAYLSIEQLQLEICSGL